MNSDTFILKGVVLIRSPKWIDRSVLADMYFIGKLKERTIQTLDDLRCYHIPLLERSKTRCIEMIKEVTGVEEYELFTYLTKKATLHFVYITNQCINNSGHFNFDKVLHALKQASQCNIYSALTVESYERYLHYRDHFYKTDKQNWIYELIEKKQQTDILLEGSQFMLIYDKLWDKQTVDDMHLLALCKDRSLMSLRDLRGEHTPLLKQLDKQCKMFIKDQYEIDEIYSYIHYPPSAWSLHIHFTHKKIVEPNKYTVEEVIKNLDLNPDYYVGEMVLAVYHSF